MTFYEQLANSLQPDRTLVYKTVGKRELLLHIFHPPGFTQDQQYPCFAFVHGGGWVNGTPRIAYPFAHAMAKLGWVGISIEYRLIQNPDYPEITVADCVRDGRSAMRYLRGHADELSINPQGIVLGGSSAGGHVAAGAALFPDINEADDDISISPKPNALVLINPVIDTSPQGYGCEKIGDSWQDLSPLHNVAPNVPPCILFHGTADATTPFAGAEAFHRAMLASGNICQLHPHEGGGHGYLRAQELFEPAIVTIASFLQRQGLGDGGTGSA